MAQVIVVCRGSLLPAGWARAAMAAPGRWSSGVLRAVPWVRRSYLILSFIAGWPAASAEAATYQVGPGRTYPNLQAVAGLLSPGDLVEVDGGATYPGDVTFRRPGTAGQPIVIRGVRVGGQRPVLSGGTNTVHFRTDSIGSGADHYVLEGFEITGGSSRCVFHQSNQLTLRDVVVHDCPAQGILGADWGSGSITIERSEVYRCGGGTQNHQIYIGMDEDNYPGGVFRMQHNWVHDGNGGNNVKSRAARNEIYYNRIEGAYYHELELIGAECCAEAVVREDSDVVGNLLIKRGPNADFAVTRVGGDGTAQTWGRYRFANNTVVVAGGAAVFRIFDGLESIEMHNNVLYRAGAGVNVMRTVEAVWRNGPQVAGSNNWISSGSTNVPATWSGTLTGISPGFANAAAGDYSPVAGSPLIDAGNGSPSGPPGYPFPNPLSSPAFQPPHPPAAFGSPSPRPFDGQIDVGAYEANSRIDQPSDFHTVTPCRLLDTRLANGAYGGPAIPPAGQRVVVAAGPQCGIPASASAVSLNVTAVTPSARGHLSFRPGTSALNFSPGQTRANNAIVALTPGAGTLVCGNSSTASLHVVIDVNGYFE